MRIIKKYQDPDGGINNNNQITQEDRDIAWMRYLSIGIGVVAIN